MAYSPVNSLAEGLGSSGGTSSAIDTTGADILVVVVGSYEGGPTPAISDSKSNSWTDLAEHATVVGGAVHISYSVNPTVGASHTFTLGGGSNQYSFVVVYAFSGADTSTPKDQDTGAAGTGTSLATGSVTPTADGELIVAGFAEDSSISGLGIDSGFSTPDEVTYSGGNYEGGAGAYLIQGTAAAVNPTWSWTTARGAGAAIATFKAAAGGGGTAVPVFWHHYNSLRRGA